MKKTVSIILTIVMTLCMITNVFAITPILDANGEKVLTAVTNPLKGTSGVDDAHTAWEFKSPTGFYYTVIPERYEEGENGEKLYFVVSNTYYGKIPGMSTALATTATKEQRAKFIFDPEISGSYAEWLNNGFLDGSAAAEGHNACTGAALDEGIRDYIAEHDWYVEGYGPNTSGSENIDEKYYYDYTVRCKVSLLSTSEIATYGKYMKQSLKFANGNAVPADLAYSCLLRTFGQLGSTKNNGVFIRRYVQSSGNTGNINTSYCGIRPCFYVSEDYFKNVKLDLANMGSEVKKIVSELGAGIYTDPADKLALKNITVYTEDASANLDTAKWTNAANATVANNIIEIKTNKWIGRKINMQGGTVSIEADVNDASGADLHIGFRYDTDTGGPDYKYPLYLSTVDENSNYPIRYYSKENGNYDSGEYKRLENSYNGVKHSTSDKPFTLRLNVNLDTGMCYVAVISKNTDGESVVRYSTLADASKYINSTKAFQDVAFWNKSSSNTVKISNVKITYDQNSSAIKNVTATGSKKIEVEFADYANIDSVEKESVLVENNTVTGIEKKDGKLYATLANSLSQNAASIVINDIKVNGIESTGYTAIGNSTQFTYTAPTETVIGTPVISGGFTKDSVVSATCSVTPNGSDDIRKLQFVVAAYNGDRLIGAKFENIENVNKAESLTSSLTLLEDATEIRAFIWDDNNYPVRSFVMEKAQ